MRRWLLAAAMLAVAVTPRAKTAMQTISDYSDRPVVPYAMFGLEVAANTGAAILIRSPSPPAVIAGVSFRYLDKGLNISVAVANGALDAQDRRVADEMQQARADAKRLHEMKAAGLDLDGDEARAIKLRLYQQVWEVQRLDNSRAGYTLAAIWRNLPYGVAQYGADQAFQAAVGFGMEKFGVYKLFDVALGWVPASVRWSLRPGGWTEALQERAGWGALGGRADSVAAATAAAMKAQEKALMAAWLREDRVKALEAFAADALGDMTLDILHLHPSAPTPVQYMPVLAIPASAFRLEAAQRGVFAAAAMAAAPAAAAPARAAALPTEPVVRAVQSDDGMAQHAGLRPFPVRPAPPRFVPAPPPAPRASGDDWTVLRRTTLTAGDGKTWTICSNGCPATAASSWTGGRGSTLYNR